MRGIEIFALLADRYQERPDEFTLSIGHHSLPEPTKPMGVYNLPEFYGYMALTVGQIRRLAAGLDSEIGGSE